MTLAHPRSIAVSDEPYLARVDGRVRLVALFVLSFAISAVRALPGIPVALGVAVLCWALSGLSFGELLRRLRYPSLLILLYVAMLLFFAGGTTLVEVGPVSVTREGLEAGSLVAARFYSILTLAISCFSVTSLLGNIAAVRGLGVPYILTDIALLMARYLEVLRADIGRMRIAMRLRGHRSAGWSIKTIKDTAWLAGSMLIRSYERSDGIYKAMRLRGYGHEPAGRRRVPLCATDWLFALVIVVLVAAVLYFGVFR